MRRLGMSKQAREPLFFKEVEEEPEPETSSAGGLKPPGRIGSGLWDEDSGQKDWRSADIEDLGLSMRAYNCLRRSGLTKINRVMERTEEELLSLRNFGRKSYDELRDKLEEVGILAADAPWDSARGVN